MESESKLQQVSDWLNEQEWYQQGKAKWDEVDPAVQAYIKIGALASVALFGVALMISSMWTVHSLKNEYMEKQELLSILNSANEEMRHLKETTAAVQGGGGAVGTWQSYFESTAESTGLDKAVLSVGGERAGSSSDATKESLYDLSLKHVSIKQVVRYAHGLETGARPVKLRNLMIDTHADPEGYMDATLAVSGFALVAK
jgi:hypothetical protein